MRHSTRWFYRAMSPLVGLSMLCLDVSTARADPAVYEIGHDPGIGFNLISWGTSANANSWRNAIDALYNAGFREVSIAPVRMVNPDTGNISAAGQQPLANIAAGVIRAKELGMRVTLDPFTELTNFSSWRANFAPAADGPIAATFWPQYQAYMVEVAALAQQHGVEAITVGTEMKGLDQNADNVGFWDSVLTAVDTVYDGQIGYAANWDNYSHPHVTANLWSHPSVDYIGIDAYFRFQNNPFVVPSSVANQVQSYPDPSFTDLMTNVWTAKLEQEILPFGASLQKPIVFTEFGVQHHNGSSRNPQNETGEVDTAEQRMVFEGLLRALDGRADVFHAVHIWQWWMTGSNGSTWNIDPTPPYDQPDNADLAHFLRDFVQTAVEPLAGDYDGDGIVGAADYVAWRNSLGNFVASFAGADGNGNGRIDQGDFAVWQANFGGSAAATSATIPEPANAILLTIAIAGLVTVRRGRQ